MTPAAWLGRTAAHADPATAAANLVALVVAGNGPFYPLSVLALTGWDRTAAWLTMLASPFFLLVPALSRRHSLAARTMLPLIGIANTWFCATLLGSASGIGFFVLPCIVLAVLPLDGADRRPGLAVIGIAIVSIVALTEFPLKGSMHLGAAETSALARLNAISVATLLGFVALTLANLLRPRAS